MAGAGIESGKAWSRIGAEVAPTGSAAPGVWGDLNEVAENIGAGNWPGPPIGFILLWGDPDATAGVSAECYPYSMSLNGTALTINTRYHGSASQSGRIASGIIALTGDPTEAPTTVTGQASWNWAITGTWTDNPYTEGWNSVVVDSSGNRYTTGALWGGATYDYYNFGVVKMDSSQAVDWNVAFYDNATTTGTGLGNRGGVLKTVTSGYVVAFTDVYQVLYFTNKQRMQFLHLNDSTGAVTNAAQYYGLLDDYSAAALDGPPKVSNVVGDTFAFGVNASGSHSGYATSSIQLVTVGSSSFTFNSWSSGATNLWNYSTGNSAIYVNSVTQDSSNNVYAIFTFAATNIDGAGLANNLAIAKWDSSGTNQWVYCLRQQAGGVEDSLQGGGIEIDGTDLYISGSSNTIGGTYSAPLIARIDVSGTPSLTWITQISNPDWNVYAQNLKRIGSDQVISLGYGQTNDPTGNAVVGVIPSLNIDGTTLGAAVVDDATWSVIDLSPYIVFATAAAGGTANVEVKQGSNTDLSWNTDTDVGAGTVSTWIHDTPATAGLGTILVESGAIG